MARAGRVALFAIGLALVGHACGGARSVTRAAGTGSRAMPDPTGCFVLVAEQPDLAGDREYISGPAQHGLLTDLPFSRNWRRRIRSAAVGSRALVTLWTGERLRGQSMTLRPDATYARLPANFDRAVQSLDIACAPSIGPP